MTDAPWKSDTGDVAAVAVVVIAFASFATAHIAIAYGLLWRAPRWRAPLALLGGPFAPYWAWREGMRIRFWVWVVAAFAYVVARVASV